MTLDAALQSAFAAIEAAEDSLIEAYGDAAPIEAVVRVERAVDETYRLEAA